MLRAASILIFALSCSPPAHAIRSSYHNANPVGWMHLLPVGEQPGWSGMAWANLEINHANIWNMQSNIRDKRTNSMYTYKADFEQSSAILELGAPITEELALTAEIPYANRNGGYVRILKYGFRQGDNAPMALVQLMDRPEVAAEAPAAEEAKAE